MVEAGRPAASKQGGLKPENSACAFSRAREIRLECRRGLINRYITVFGITGKYGVATPRFARRIVKFEERFLRCVEMTGIGRLGLRRTAIRDVDALKRAPTNESPSPREK